MTGTQDSLVWISGSAHSALGVARERGERERQVQEVARQTKELEQLRARAAHLTEVDPT